MGLRSFVAYQAECDQAGCSYVVEAGDVSLWVLSPDAMRDAWEDEENWTDGVTWLCDEHRFEPHSFVGSRYHCDRCQTNAEEHS